MVEEEARLISEMALTAYIYPLTAVSSFKYLGRLLSDSEDELPEDVSNFRKVQTKWDRLLRVIGQEGAYAWA